MSFDKIRVARSETTKIVYTRDEYGIVGIDAVTIDYYMIYRFNIDSTYKHYPYRYSHFRYRKATDNLVRVRDSDSFTITTNTDYISRIGELVPHNHEIIESFSLKIVI